MITIEKIAEMRKNILDALEEERPTLTKIIRDGEYFIVSMIVNTKKKPEAYLLMDFTCRQDEHYNDIEEYANSVYNKFHGNYQC